MMPSYYNLDDVVKEGLIKYSGYNVNCIDPVDKRVYRHTADRIVNFLSKVFLNKNLKPGMKIKLFSSIIDKFDEYEYLIVNRPDIISKVVLERAIGKSKKSILLLWDSLEKVPISEETISLFDQTYSFDQKDCDVNGFLKIENFHFVDPSLADTPSVFDIVFLGTLDKRIDDLTAIFENLRENLKNPKAYIYVPSKMNLKKQEGVEVLAEITPFKDSYKFALLGKVVLDLGHQNQRGLSFRVFEAMALKKKLITTNKNIVDYDFYNENNVLVIDDVKNFKVLKSFWETDYQDLSVELVDKYHVSNWVNRILDEA